LPEAYFRLVEQTFFDSAAHGWFDLPEGRQFLNGWVSKYGILNGADYFSTNLFSIGGYSLCFDLVELGRSTGQLLAYHDLRGWPDRRWNAVGTYI
jgi:hypothetical protein